MGSTDPRIDHSAVAEQINAQIHYTMYSVFRLDRQRLGTSTELRSAASALESTLTSIEGLTVRGWYDVAGFRADADLMVWWWAERVETLQQAYRAVLASGFGQSLVPVWSQVGTHRASEFNRAHVPAFLAGEAPRGYICVYPFVRSYEWYLLPEDERSTMLRDHGAAARDYRDVLANTVSAFALGDYEWLLSFESDDLTRIVDLMRELRATEARLHVREELPFYTGPRVTLGEFTEALRA